jgi:hypothetical protein
MYLVETTEDVASLPVTGPDKLAYVTQTTLSVDDAARMVDALRALPQHHRPKEGRHLLRHAKPPGRSEGAGATMRRGNRGVRRPVRIQIGCVKLRRTSAFRPTWWTTRQKSSPNG